MNIPINYTIPELEEDILNRKINSTIRTKNFMRKYNIKIGSIVDIKLYRRKIGSAEVIDIHMLTAEEIKDETFLKENGFKNRIYINRNLYLIKFRWL